MGTRCRKRRSNQSVSSGIRRSTDTSINGVLFFGALGRLSVPLVVTDDGLEEVSSFGHVNGIITNRRLETARTLGICSGLDSNFRGNDETRISRGEECTLGGAGVPTAHGADGGFQRTTMLASRLRQQILGSSL